VNKPLRQKKHIVQCVEHNVSNDALHDMLLLPQWFVHVFQLLVVHGKLLLLLRIQVDDDEDDNDVEVIYVRD
jgi:hypothetical protein